MTDEIKKGARNNKTDAQRLQQIHDYAVANGAQCAPPKSYRKSAMEAPNLREEDARDCENCAFYKAISQSDEMTGAEGTGICTKFDFVSQDDFVCDDWAALPAPEQQQLDMQESMEEMAAMSIDPNDMLINYGSAVKSLNGIEEKDYAVIYGGADLTKDFFEKSTEYGFAGAQTKRVPIMFNHAQPLETESGKRYVERKPIGEAELEIGDEGILIKEAILYNRKKYKDYLAELGWSTGAASHAVVAEPMPDGRSRIKQWLLSELSVTPMSAEPRLQNVVALKSLITTEAAVTDKGAQKNQEPSNQKELDMEKEEMKAMLDERDKTLIDTTKAAAKAAVEEILDALPEVKAARGVQIEVTRDPADVPFKSLGEQLQAIAKATKDGNIAPRMRGLKAMETKAALGSNEAIPSQGEFLLEPTVTQTLLQNIHENGVFTQDVQKLPVGPNSNSGWIPGVDETSRATGSRWGGVRGYHSAEAATMTASQPKFRKINWELHKTYVLQYASDELLNDVGMLNAIIQKSSMEELDFMANYDVLLGVGGDRPAGVLNSGALISVSRAATSAIAHADIVAMWARMLPRNKARAKWYISSDVHAQLDQLTFTSGTTGILSPYVSYGPDGVMRIYGKPVVETEFNPALGTLGDILLADMSEYLYWEKNAVEAASSIHVQFLTDQTAFRFIYRNDGQSALASAITPANGGNTQSPFVALLATT